MKIPYDCPRGRNDCIALSNIIATNKTSFYCCGENKIEGKAAEQDIYTLCFKGEFDDRIHFCDKRDLTHQAAVIIQSLAVIENPVGDDTVWSAWGIE